MATELIAVTGASGSIGSAVAKRLAGHTLTRLIARDAGRVQRLPGVEVRSASAYGATDQMRRALEDVRTLFLVSGREAEDRVAEHKSAIDAAVAAGVQRLVYLSFVGAAPDAIFTLARHHWETEQYVRATPLRFTFLRDCMYMDLIPDLVGEDGVIRGPAGDGRVAAVARQDVADVAAAVLLGAGEDGATYDVTGPEAFTLAQAAAMLSAATGDDITFQDETLEEAFASRAELGAPEWRVEGWVSSYSAVAAGALATVTDTVQRLAGHAPLTFTEYLEQSA